MNPTPPSDKDAVSVHAMTAAFSLREATRNERSGTSTRCPYKTQKIANTTLRLTATQVYFNYCYWREADVIE